MPMSLGPSVLTLCLWVCFTAVFYVYFGYPLVISCLARLFGRRRLESPLAEEELPTVSLLITAYNEDAVIDRRLRNALGLSYPREKLEIVVTTDGCTDRTVEIVRG